MAPEWLVLRAASGNYRALPIAGRVCPAISYFFELGALSGFIAPDPPLGGGGWCDAWTAAPLRMSWEPG